MAALISHPRVPDSPMTTETGASGTRNTATVQDIGQVKAPLRAALTGTFQPIRRTGKAASCGSTRVAARSACQGAVGAQAIQGIARGIRNTDPTANATTRQPASAAVTGEGAAGCASGAAISAGVSGGAVAAAGGAPLKTRYPPMAATSIRAAITAIKKRLRYSGRGQT